MIQTSPLLMGPNGCETGMLLSGQEAELSGPLQQSGWALSGDRLFHFACL